MNSIFPFILWGKKGRRGKWQKSERTKEEWDEVDFKYLYIYYFNPHDYKIWNFYEHVNLAKSVNRHHSLILSTLLILPLCIFVFSDLIIEWYTPDSQQDLLNDMRSKSVGPSLWITILCTFIRWSIMYWRFFIDGIYM